MTDPLTIKLCGRDPDKERIVHNLMLAPAYEAGQVYVIRLKSAPHGSEEDARIECLVTITEPGNTAWPPVKQKYDSMAFSSISPSAKEWFEQVVRPMSAEGKAKIPNGQQASYYVHVLATSLSAQRKGLAKAILKHVEDQARNAGAVVALSTQMDYTAEVYQRCGYRIAYQSPLIWGDGLEDSSYYVMVNDASASQV
ncbi:hypothetical protein IAU59_007328 [Kwoniella sp. CBS 9459]